MMAEDDHQSRNCSPLPSLEDPHDNPSPTSVVNSGSPGAARQKTERQKKRQKGKEVESESNNGSCYSPTEKRVRTTSSSLDNISSPISSSASVSSETADAASQIKTTKKGKKGKGRNADSESDCNNEPPKKMMKQKTNPAIAPSSATTVSTSSVMETSHESVWSKLGVLKCEKCGFTTSTQAYFNCHTCGIRKPRTHPQHQVLNAPPESKKQFEQGVSSLPKKLSLPKSSSVVSVAERNKHSKCEKLSLGASSTTPLATDKNRFVCIVPKIASAMIDTSSLSPPTATVANPVTAVPMHVASASDVSVAQSVTMHSTPQEACSLGPDVGQPRVALAVASSQPTASLDSLHSDPWTNALAVASSPPMATLESDPQTVERRQGFVRYDESTLNFVCMQCKFTAKEDNGLTEHMLYQLVANPYSCVHCKKVFPSRIVFQQHFAQDHEGKKVECKLHNVRAVKKILCEAKEAAKLGKSQAFPLHSTFKSCIKRVSTVVNPTESQAPESFLPSSSQSLSKKSTCALLPSSNPETGCILERKDTDDQEPVLKNESGIVDLFAESTKKDGGFLKIVAFQGNYTEHEDSSVEPGFLPQRESRHVGEASVSSQSSPAMLNSTVSIPVVSCWAGTILTSEAIGDATVPLPVVASASVTQVPVNSEQAFVASQAVHNQTVTCEGTAKSVSNKAFNDSVAISETLFASGVIDQTGSSAENLVSAHPSSLVSSSNSRSFFAAPVELSVSSQCIETAQNAIVASQSQLAPVIPSRQSADSYASFQSHGWRFHSPNSNQVITACYDDDHTSGTSDLPAYTSHQATSFGQNVKPLHESGRCDSWTFRDVSRDTGQNIQRTLREINSHASDQANPQVPSVLVGSEQGLSLPNLYDSVYQTREVLNSTQSYQPSSYACWQTSQQHFMPPTLVRPQLERESFMKFGTPSDIQSNSRWNSLSAESSRVLHSNASKSSRYSIAQNNGVVNAIQRAVSNRLREHPVASSLSGTAIHTLHSTGNLGYQQRTSTASDSIQVPVVSVTESQAGERYSPISPSSHVMPEVDVTESNARERYCPISPSSHVPAMSVTEQFAGKRYSPISPSSQVSAVNVTEHNGGERYSPISPSSHVLEVSVTESNAGRSYSPISPAACRSPVCSAVSPTSPPVPIRSARSYSPITPPLYHSASVTDTLQPLDLSLTVTEQTDDCDLVGEATPISTLSEEPPARCASSLIIGTNHSASAHTTIMADENGDKSSALAAAIDVSSASLVLSDSQALGSWNGFFVKFFKSYACLPCSKRFQDKQTFYDHVWNHMHPERQQCASCIDTADSSCLKTTETVDSVSSCVDQNIIFRLKNDYRKKLLPKLFRRNSSPFHRSDGDSVGSPTSIAHLHGQPSYSGSGLEISMVANVHSESEKSAPEDLEVTSAHCPSEAEDVGSDLNTDTGVECREAEQTDDESQVYNHSPLPCSSSLAVDDHTGEKSDVTREEMLTDHESSNSTLSIGMFETLSRNKQGMEKGNMKSTVVDMNAIGGEEEAMDTNEGIAVRSLNQVGQHKTSELTTQCVVENIEEAPQGPGYGEVRNLNLDNRSIGESSMCKEGERPCSTGTEAFSRYSVFFICSLCSFSCDTAIDFTIHLNADHHNEKFFPCYHCNYSGQYTTDLTDHIRAHTMGDRNIYLCPCYSGCCLFKTDNLHHLRGHMEEDHQDCTVFKCHRCDSTFMDGKEFLQHAQQNSITVYTCTKCSARFLQKTAIQQHWRTIHTIGSLCYFVVKVLLCWDRKTNAYHTFDDTVSVNKATDAHSVENSSSDNAKSVMPLPAPDVARPVFQNSTTFADSHTAESVSGDHVSHVQNSHGVANILVSMSETSALVTDTDSKDNISEAQSKEPVAIQALPKKSVVDVVNEPSLKTPEEVDKDFVPAQQNCFIPVERPNGNHLSASTSCLSIVEGHIIENKDMECPQKFENPVEKSVSDHTESPLPLCIIAQEQTDILPTTLAETTADQNYLSDAIADCHDHDISQTAAMSPPLSIISQEHTNILLTIPAETTVDQNYLSDAVADCHDHDISQTAETAAVSPELCDNRVSQTAASSSEPADTIVSQTTAVSAELSVMEREEMIKLTELFGSNELHKAFLGHLYCENDGLFCCSICEKKLHGRNCIQEHLFIHFKVPLFSCCFCLYQSSERCHLKTHISQKHPDQKAKINFLMVHREHLFQTFEKEKPLTIQKFATICNQLKVDNKHSKQSGPGGLTHEKDSDFFARSHAETVFPDRHEINSSIQNAVVVHRNADTKRSDAAACTEKVSATLKNPVHHQSNGVGHCGVKSFKRSMVTHRRESAAEKRPRDSEDQFELKDSSGKVHVPVTKFHSSEKLMQKSTDKDSEVKHKIPARPKIGTYTVVKKGAIRKLKCISCGKMTFSPGAMSRHLENCSHYLNTQSVSEHTGHAGSLVEQMRAKKFPSLNLKSTLSNSKTDPDQSRHNDRLDSASSRICGKQFKHSTKSHKAIPQKSKSFEKETRKMPSKNVKCVEKAFRSSRKSKNVELCPALASKETGCANGLDDVISLGLNYTQTVSKFSESYEEENPTVERSNIDVNSEDKQSDEDSGMKDNVPLYSRRTRKNKLPLLDSSSDEDEAVDEITSDTDFKKRKEIKADSEQILQCKHCNFTAPSSRKSELQNHLHSQHQRLLGLTKCGHCGSLYGNLTILKRHIKSVHPGKPELQEHVQYYEFFKDKEEESRFTKHHLEQQSDKVTSEPKFPDTKSEGFTNFLTSIHSSETANVNAEVNDDFSSKASTSFSSVASSRELFTTGSEHQAVKDAPLLSAFSAYTCGLDTDRESSANLLTSMEVEPASISRSGHKFDVEKEPPSSPDGKNSSSGGSRTITHKFQCVLCSEKLENQCNAYAHLCKHLDYRPARCGICYKQFETVAELTAHHSKKHPGRPMSQRSVYSPEKEKELSRLLRDSCMVEEAVSIPAVPPETRVGHRELHEKVFPTYSRTELRQSIQCQFCQVLLDSISQFRSHCMADHGIPNDSTKMHWLDSDSKIVYDLEGNVISQTCSSKSSMFRHLCAFCSHRFSVRFCRPSLPCSHGDLSFSGFGGVLESRNIQRWGSDMSGAEDGFLSLEFLREFLNENKILGVITGDVEFLPWADASEHARNEHVDLKCYWIVKLASAAWPHTSAQKSVTATSTYSLQASVTTTSTYSQQKSITTTSTQQRNVETTISGATSVILVNESASQGHRDAVGDSEREDSGQRCRREVSCHVDREPKIVLKDFLSPHQIHEFKTLLLSNGITLFHLGDNLSSETQAYLMNNFMP